MSGHEHHQAGAEDHHEDSYRGPARLVIAAPGSAPAGVGQDPGGQDPGGGLLDGEAVEVEVVLRGGVQPIDGYYRWYGRIAASEELEALAGGRKKQVRIITPAGSADGEISDPDPWNRYRISGVSTPPFRTALAGRP